MSTRPNTCQIVPTTFHGISSGSAISTRQTETPQPRRGFWVSVCLVLMALPLLIPWNVVGAMWNILALPDIGLLGRGLNALGIEYNYTRQPFAAWFTTVLMDVWHWTSLVVLLCYAGLVSIPDAYYQAAKIDGASRWSVFRYIQLPKMHRVLLIAVLLRFMDSFMIYTEPFVVTGGGPGNETTFQGMSSEIATTTSTAEACHPFAGIDSASMMPSGISTSSTASENVSWRASAACWSLSRITDTNHSVPTKTRRSGEMMSCTE